MTKNKKASLPPMEVTIGIIVFLISLVIIVMIWRNLFMEQQTAEQVCYASVVARSVASSDVLRTQFRESTKLRCNTEKICFVSDKSGECKSLGADYTKVEVGSDKNAVLDYIAEDMYTWHTTLGEGKMNFMPRSIVGKKYCFLGSLMAFDKNTADSIEQQGGITYYELYTTLEDKETEDGRTYLQALYNKNLYDFISYSKSLSIPIGDQRVKLDLHTSKIDLYGEHMVIVRMIEDGWWTTIVGGVAGVAGAGFVLVTSPISLPVLSVLAIGGAIGAYSATDAPDHSSTYKYIPPVFSPYSIQNLQGSECDSFETLG